ncbi:helix-turn-helix domain-containing protein [Pusillimonas sp.]|uniref:response regulator transcription factor n=1 Tax=Pusillimonas sp. TaxID=3040095 RepID=UPI0029AA14C4|nr:helix-turn-helix domain-containing protein [Pusillimonas sp.]MDX3896028.1 helix-turn-helix domain-containing protein [Pusillimonas sp.]
MHILDSTPVTDAEQPQLLLVDDDPDQLRLLVEALRIMPWRLSLAFDGMRGYERAVAIMPDLIILDVRMPRLDGFALCRSLKANPSTAHIPILFLSSATDIDERLTGLRGGAVDYILKPYIPEEVIARVQIHLDLAGKAAGREAATRVPASMQNESRTSAAEPLGHDAVLVRAAQRELLSLHNAHLGNIAASLGVSERRLSRAFQKVLGMSLFEYLRQERMEQAKRLLMQTALSVLAISQEVGFTSAANFSTAFREHTGMTPSEYRRKSGQA